jgi:ferredoxin
VSGPGKGDRVRAVVDHDLCAGVAMCLQQAPGAFALDATGQAVFAAPGEWSAQDLEAAAEACPTEAISVLGPQAAG